MGVQAVVQVQFKSIKIIKLMKKQNEQTQNNKEISLIKVFKLKFKILKNKLKKNMHK